MPDVSLTRVRADGRVVFERLMQLHLYETGMDPGPDGLIDWGEPLDPFFSEKSCIPFFFTKAGNAAGFALVRLDYRLPGPDAETRVQANFIEEFHILRRYRRKGVGTRAADLLFEGYPGRWMISAWPEGERVFFWRHVATERPGVNGTEFGPDEHKGFPEQYVWVIENAGAVS